MSVRVVPESPDGFGFGQPVRYEATVKLVHSNYPAAKGRVPTQQRIQMTLGDITGLGVGDIVPLDDMLQSCLVEVAPDGAIHVDIGGDGLVTFVCKALTIEEANDDGG